MLGSVEVGGAWRFGAFGKHPAARDYFRVGSSTPMTEGFSGWVEEGYGKIGGGRSRSAYDAQSWRFWARSSGKDGLVCGVVRDSSDSLGRPFPLLVAGSGPLRGWQLRWDLLSLACEATWAGIEYLATIRHENLRAIEDRIRGLRAPSPAWEGHEERLRSLQIPPESPVPIPAGPEFVVPLKDDGNGDPFGKAAAWHVWLKCRPGEIPNALFWGGAPGVSRLAVFRRPLISSDFARIWSVPSAGQEGAAPPPPNESREGSCR